MPTQFGFLLINALLIFGLIGTAQGDSKQTSSAEGLARATFAGGCFWCMEHPYDELEGVKSTTSGYTGGHLENPTYREVSSGSTGHTEVVVVIYNPKKISYEELLKVFWRNIDPLTPNRQFCDAGSQYRTGIFYHNEQHLPVGLSPELPETPIATAGIAVDGILDRVGTGGWVHGVPVFLAIGYSPGADLTHRR